MGETSYQLVQDVFHQPYVNSQEGIWYDFYTVETRNFDSKETFQLHPRNMDPSIPLTIVLLPVVDWVSWSSPSWCDISPSNQKAKEWIDIISYPCFRYIQYDTIYIFTCNHFCWFVVLYIHLLLLNAIFLQAYPRSAGAQVDSRTNIGGELLR